MARAWERLRARHLRAHCWGVVASMVGGTKTFETVLEGGLLLDVGGRREMAKGTVGSSGVSKKSMLMEEIDAVVVGRRRQIMGDSLWVSKS
jgi:hypothetical protein